MSRINKNSAAARGEHPAQQQDSARRNDEGTAMSLEERMALVRNEFVQEALPKAPDLAVCRQVLWDTILGVRGVQTINRLDLSINKATRVLTVTFVVNGTDSFTSTITV